MDTVSQFLAKYKQLAPPERTMLKFVQSVVYSECGITLEDAELKLSRGGVLLNCHPTVRSEIVRYTPHILSTLHRTHNIRLSFIR
jgi:hypothetical protein